ncbi:MAG: DEAD/DEAH box helicase [Ktedonobacterales bacterium]|nr:DEAD/DEAH box helicase [Ktedonobacterales bacterium]
MPYVLHATLARDVVFLWLERPPDLAELNKHLRGEWASAKEPSYALSTNTTPTYPFQPLSAKRDEVEGIFRRLLTAAGVFFPPELASAPLWLPTYKQCPLPAKLIDGGQPPTHLTPRLHAWTVIGQYITMVDAALFFLAIPSLWENFADIEMGYDLAFWASLAQYAAVLLAGGRVLPTTRLAPQGNITAAWEPILDQKEQLRCAMFARHMPLVCRAAQHLHSDGALLPAEDACEAILRGMVDGQMRICLQARSANDGQPTRLSSPYQLWLQALQATNPALPLPSAAAMKWHLHLAEWRARAEMVRELPVRLVWQVYEPSTEEDETWTLSPFLEDVTDPSSRFPLSAISEIASELPSGFKTISATRCREILRYALAYSPMLHGRIDCDALTSATCTTDELLTFLRDEAPTLIAAGFGVYFPTWWEEATQRRTLTVSGAIRQPTGEEATLTYDALLEVDWQLALGDETITLRELETLAALKSPLVRWRGRWARLDQQALQHGLALIRRRRKTTFTQMLQIFLDQERTPVPGVQEEWISQGSIDELMGYLRGHQKIKELPPPPGLNATLRPYQQRGVNWLFFLTEHGLSPLLADSMGLGKTVQALALLQYQRARPNSGPFLVVTTTSSVTNWQQEAQRFCNLNPLIHHGQRRHREDLWQAALRHELVVTSYQVLLRDVELLRQIPWQGVILDEAHQVKNHGTKQARAARALNARYRLALTGTPVENSALDIHAIESFLNPGLLGSQEAFRQRFILPMQRDDDDAKHELQQLLAPFILRRLKTDPEIAPELPPKIEEIEYCTLTTEQAGIYAGILQHMEETLADTDPFKRQGAVFRLIQRLKQCCNHPAHYLKERSPLPRRSGKLLRLEELLADALAEDQRILVFTQFADWGKTLQPYLAERFGEEVLFFAGHSTRKQRAEMVERFEHEEQGPRIFLISLKAGGNALNLVRASTVIHYDRWWTKAAEDQATDRAHRIGQTKTVHVHTLVCAGTLEQRIADLIDGKQRLADDIIVSNEHDLEKLSIDQLRDLLALQQDSLAAFEPMYLE